MARGFTSSDVRSSATTATMKTQRKARTPLELEIVATLGEEKFTKYVEQCEAELAATLAAAAGRVPIQQLTEKAGLHHQVGSADDILGRQIADALQFTDFRYCTQCGGDRWAQGGFTLKAIATADRPGRCTACCEHHHGVLAKVEGMAAAQAASEPSSTVSALEITRRPPRRQ